MDKDELEAQWLNGNREHVIDAMLTAVNENAITGLIDCLQLMRRDVMHKERGVVEALLMRREGL